MSIKDKDEFILLVDLDGVCANIHPRWIEMYNEDYEDNLTLEDIDQWTIHNCVKPECYTGIYEYLDMPGFFYGAPTVEGCVKALKELHEAGVRIVICTACPKLSTTGAYEKHRWVGKYLPFVDTDDFIATHNKYLVRGDALIDDAPHNLADFPGTTIAYTRPWNRGAPSTLRIDDWEEAKLVILGLQDEKKWATIDEKAANNV